MIMATLLTAKPYKLFCNSSIKHKHNEV